VSRVLVLGRDNVSVGEFDAICTLGYTLDGNPGVAGGGSTEIPIPASVSTETWFQFGRLVIVQPEDLPAYVGMIDTPMRISEPVAITVYDPEYLLDLRVPEVPVMFTGSVDKIFSQILDVANSLEDLYLRLGSVGVIDTTYREETLDSRSLWEQAQALGLRSGTEFLFRPQRGESDRWFIFVDLAQEMGVDTEFLLSDGENGNMTVTEAVVSGQIINRMVGINSAAGEESRLYTEPLVDDTSIQTYRVRNRIVQSRDVNDINTLRVNTQNALNASSTPYLELSVQVKNVNHAFVHLRPGNRLLAHASKLYLPGGRAGWRGITRITRMAYVEANKTVDLTLIGALE
jgi:hypothetical protein